MKFYKNDDDFELHKCAYCVLYGVILLVWKPDQNFHVKIILNLFFKDAWKSFFQGLFKKLFFFFFFCKILESLSLFLLQDPLSFLTFTQPKTKRKNRTGTYK